MDLGGMENAPLELVIKSTATYRVKRIDIQTREEINQIKITYDDDSVWSCGQDGGTKDKRPLIMTKGEYLARVCHERLYNYRSAGACIEFETNKGRILKYQPGNGWRGVATGWKSEQTTINADQGMEIISLIIRRGVLMGSEQQAVPSEELVESPGTSSWYVYCYSAVKEDTKDNGSDVIYQHFHNKAKAFQAWKLNQKTLNSKKGRGGILVDCIKSKVVKQNGDTSSVERCIEEATKEGFCMPSRDEETSIFEVLWTLYKSTISRKELVLFFVGIILTFFSDTLGIHGQLIRGELLAFLVSNQTELLQRNHYLQATCNTVFSCEVNDNLSLCKALLITAFILKLLELAFSMGNVYINRMINVTKRLDLEHEILAHTMTLDHTFFDTHSYSHISGSMNICSIYHLVTHQIPSLISTTINFITTLYYLLAIDIYLGGFCVLLTFLWSIGIMNRILGKMQTANKFEWKWEKALGDIRGKVLSNFTIIKLFSNEDQHIVEHDLIRQECIKSLKFNVLYQCLYRFASGMMNTVVFGGCLYLCLHYLKHSGMTTGQITGFFLLLREFQGITARLLGQNEWTEWRGSFRDLDRYVRLKDEIPKLKDGYIKPKDVKGEIVFKDVHFSYPSRPTETVLKGFNMVIKPYKMTAIVGDSGAGKSTISKLIMRLYDPHSGTITIDGNDIKTLDIKHLHQQMTIVDQNPKLFGATLAENIGYGSVNNHYTQEELKGAAELANCGFIKKFRAGFQTFAGNGDTQISGGQKQRVAIARAAIRNPKILILDEATSSLDSENEKEVQEALENVMKGRTIVVIAHRLSTIRNADHILCMKDGQLVEQGTHDKLMELNGVYHNLISKQIISESKKKQ